LVRQQLVEAVDEELLGTDNQDLVPALFLQRAQGHAVFLEELDELVAGNAPVLAARDTVAAQPAGIEPLAHRPWRDLTDLRHLAGGKHFFHGRHSSFQKTKPAPWPADAGSPTRELPPPSATHGAGRLRERPPGASCRRIIAGDPS